MLWRRFAGDKAGDRDERLLWSARQLGKVVDSITLLSEADLDLLIAELRGATKEPRGSRRVLAFPRGGSDMAASKEAVWKIRQVAAYIGMDDARLAAFLAKRLRFEGAIETISRAKAWRATEALVGVAAQESLCASLGRKPTREEKTLEMARLKEVLTTWRAA